MIVIRVLYWIVFLIQMICFPACINTDIRRQYGRVFHTRVDTDIYNKVFYCMAICVIILFIIILIMG